MDLKQIIDGGAPEVTDFTDVNKAVYSGDIDTQTDEFYYLYKLAKYNGLPFESFAISQINTDIVASASDVVADIIAKEAFSINNSSIIVAFGTAPTGSSIIVNMYKNGTTIFSTAISIDATEKTNLTAATPYALSTNPTTFAIGDQITVKITQVGATIAGQNGTVYIFYTRT